MQLQPADILTRKEKDGQTVWISQRLLVAECGISDGVLKVQRTRYKKSVPASRRGDSVLPDTGRAWRWARMQGGFYYALPNIPDRAPARYQSMLPAEEELLAKAAGQQVQKGSELKEHAAAEIRRQVGTLVQADDVQYYRYDSRPTFPPDKARGLARSLAWLRYLRQAMDTGSHERLGIRRKTDFMDICAKAIGREANHGLETKSAQYLYSRLADFPSMGVDAQRRAMIPGRYGNQNAAIVGKELLVDELTGEQHPFDMHQALMYSLYMNPGSSVKEDMLPLHERYVSDVEEMGLRPIAYRTFCNHLSRFNSRLRNSRERHGRDYFKKNVLPYVPGERLKYAHSLFAGDGSSTIAYRWRNSKGELKSRNVYVVLISDTASRYIAGYSVAPEGSSKEEPIMTRRAVSMAAEAGGFQTMHELVTDNHTAFTEREIKDWLQHAFGKVRTIEVGNSQSNPAETQFRLFKKTLKSFYNFLRTSWNASIEGQANPDYVRTEDLPDYHRAVELLEEAIHTWNHRAMGDGSTPAERWAEKHPECRAMDQRQVRYLFGKRVKVSTRYLRGFIQVDSGKALFEIPDYFGTGADLIAKGTGYAETAQLAVMWDEKGADIYSQEGAWLMTCPPAARAIQAEAEKTDEHRQAESHHMARKAQETDRVADFERGVASAAETVRDIKRATAEESDESADRMPYTLAMATGGSKDSYNGSMEGLEEEETTGRGEKDTPWTDEDRIRAYARSQM